MSRAAAARASGLSTSTPAEGRDQRRQKLLGRGLDVLPIGAKRQRCSWRCRRDPGTTRRLDALGDRAALPASCRARWRRRPRPRPPARMPATSSATVVTSLAGAEARGVRSGAARQLRASGLCTSRWSVDRRQAVHRGVTDEHRRPLADSARTSRLERNRRSGAAAAQELGGALTALRPFPRRDGNRCRSRRCARAGAAARR